jgi:hypothetical protein
MIDRVSKLTVVDSGASANLSEDALLQRIIAFVDENLLDLSGDYDQDVQFEQARSDEKRLGALSPFERKAFALSALLEQRLNEIMVEVEAGSADQITAIMRERKISFTAAMQVHAQGMQIPEELRLEINMCALTHANLASLFDWSVRHRFNEWSAFLIVRTGFVAYSYG